MVTPRHGLGHPILDGRLRFFGANLSEPLRQHLRQPAICEALLATLYAHPRSAINSGQLAIRVKGKLGARLEYILQEAITLTQRLSNAEVLS